MNLRFLTEEYERQCLAPYATKCYESEGRKFPEKEDIIRTCFQRDRDRIFFSQSFRKLQFKTQVYTTQVGQPYRNRYIHSLQVALHARTIARILRANEDLCEAIAYAHDIGHPPFGHAGENEICLISKEKGGFEFEHNNQSIRVVALLEKRNGKNGLNLCCETLEGIVRHHTISDRAIEIPQEYLKYNSPSLEAQIVNVADEIAFSIHDLYDSFKTNLITESQRLNLQKLKIWKDGNGRLGIMTHILINDVLENSLANLNEIYSIEELRNRPRVCWFSEKTETKLRELQNFLLQNVYKSKRVVEMDKIGKKIIKDLFNQFWRNPDLLPSEFFERLRDEEKITVLIDYLVSLTDIEAIELYHEFFPAMKG